MTPTRAPRGTATHLIASEDEQASKGKERATENNRFYTTIASAASQNGVGIHDESSSSGSAMSTTCRNSFAALAVDAALVPSVTFPWSTPTTHSPGKQLQMRGRKGWKLGSAYQERPWFPHRIHASKMWWGDMEDFLVSNQTISDSTPKDMLLSLRQYIQWHSLNDC